MVSFFSLFLMTAGLAVSIQAASIDRHGVASHRHRSSLKAAGKARVARRSMKICKPKTSSSTVIMMTTSVPQITTTTTTAAHTTTASSAKAAAKDSFLDKEVVPAVVHTTTTQAAQPLTTSPSDSNSNSGSGHASGGLTAEQQEAFLTLHNNARATHGAALLTWSDNLANIAQGWADRCNFVHSHGALGPFGENLAAGTMDSYNVADAMSSWLGEEKDYIPSVYDTPGSKLTALHYTQIVWKATTQVGCGLAPACAGIFPGYGPAKYFVCEYNPGGNIVGDFHIQAEV